MPIYEYKCKKCGNIFETLTFSIQEKQPVFCPSCGSKKTEKLMSMFGGKFGNTSSGTGCSTCSQTSCSPG